jgi:HTH-type transcriptional regulator / antitoxin HigA
MDVRAIKSEADYEWALKEIERYFDNQPIPGTPDGDRFDVLATLVEAYEQKHDAIPEADPIDILGFAIDDMGRSQNELARILGSRSRASEVLNRKRALTVQMIHDISRDWHLPVEALARPYALAPNKTKPTKRSRADPSGGAKKTGRKSLGRSRKAATTSKRA